MNVTGGVRERLSRVDNDYDNDHDEGRGTA